MWGGLTIFTSRPYALCHQLSNGAEVTITKGPQIVTQAPSGPRNPQNRTDSARCSGVPRKVVCSTNQPQLEPAMMAPSCSRKCGAVEKVSRPMVLCQEMSQRSPTTMARDEKITA